MCAVETSEEQTALIPLASSTGDTVEDDEGMGWTDLGAASEVELDEPNENQDSQSCNDDHEGFSLVLKATKDGLDALSLSYNVHLESDDDASSTGDATEDDEDDEDFFPLFHDIDPESDDESSSAGDTTEVDEIMYVEDREDFSPVLKANKVGLDEMNLSYNVHPESDDNASSTGDTAEDDESLYDEDHEDFSPLLKATKIGLDSRDVTIYKVHPQNEDGITTITFEADMAFARDVPFRIVTNESSGLFILMLHMPTLVPEERRTIVSEYWNHVNYNLNVGNFEMDPRDGEVRFRVATVFQNTPMSPEMVGVAVDIAVSTTRQHLPGQFHVVNGDMDVVTAYHTARNYQ